MICKTKIEFGRLMSLLLLLLASMTFNVFAYEFTLTGKAAGSYPIVIEVNRTQYGAIEGRYAYNSTLNRLGRNDPNAWLYISPLGDSTSDYIIRDADGNVQERWTNVRFWRSNGVNRMDAGVTNARGKTFGISAESSSVATASWAGTYSIYSEGYRLCPPPISAILTLSKSQSNQYSGTLSMIVADDIDNSSGSLKAQVSGTLNNGVLTIKLDSYKVKAGNYDTIFCKGSSSYPVLITGTNIAQITKSGDNFTIKPLGNMKDYLTDIIDLTIVKIN